MAWSSRQKNEWDSSKRDVLLSVSDEGVLAFWILTEGNGADLSSKNTNSAEWRCTQTVRTGRKGFRLASCSSAKKSALGANYVCLIEP